MGAAAQHEKNTIDIAYEKEGRGNAGGANELERGPARVGLILRNLSSAIMVEEKRGGGRVDRSKGGRGHHALRLFGE